MNGWLLVRIAGIVVGIVTLLRLATMQGLVTYDKLFQVWLEWVNEIVETALLTKFIGPFLHWFIDQVRSFGINVDLQDQWRISWVLSVLMLWTVARYTRNWLVYLAALILALGITILSGLIGSVLPLAYGLLVAMSAIFISMVIGTDGFAARAFVVAIVTIAAYLSGFVVAFLLRLAGFSVPQVLPVMLTVGAPVGLALFALIAGVLESWKGGWRAVIANSQFNIGLDILSATLGALFFASIFATPPIW